MSNIKILFRIPLTLYFLCWDRDLKVFVFATKQFNNKYYYWHFIK